MVKSKAKRAASGVFHNVLVSFGSVGATVLLFLLLPMINKIAEGDRPDTLIRSVDVTELPQEDDVVEEEEPEPEEEPEEEPPPELVEDVQPLDLAQLEMALDAGIGDGVGAGLAIDLSKALGTKGGIEELFSAADLDAKPRPRNQSQPVLTNREKKATPGRAVVIFIVDERGRVLDPKVQQASHPDLGTAALRTIKKWRFEPGTRKGEPVRFRMRIPLAFPKQ